MRHTVASPKSRHCSQKVFPHIDLYGDGSLTMHYRQLQCLCLLVDLFRQEPALGDMQTTLLEVKLNWPASLRLWKEHFQVSSPPLSQAANWIIQFYEENSGLFETMATQKSDFPSGSALSPYEKRARCGD